MVFCATLGSGATFALSSSDMPFLKALMPCATSPISSEILPRPNSSSTTPMTMIQCQILRPPMAYSSASGPRAARNQVRLCGEPRRHARQKQGPAVRRAPAVGDVGIAGFEATAKCSSGAASLPSPTRGRVKSLLRLGARGERKVEVALLQRLLVLTQRGIVRRHRHVEAGWQAAIEQ